jgi:anaerobic dimethyl sulfoxide reductase subunit A
MKRVGKRGEGKFEQISWEEALDTVASEIKRIKDTYGNSALFVPYGTGSRSNINGSPVARRLLNLYGGHLSTYSTYSSACVAIATPTVFGTGATGSQRKDWLNSRYIILWGWNPAETIFGTNSSYYLKKARENGARIICIDPRNSMSAIGLADEWIPIRPGTDTAMMSAMAYVMIIEDIYDARFVDSHCIGFDETQMPVGLQNEETFKDYILGTRDGIAKTPEWAEAITTVPREKIVQVAREYATTKPAMLYLGYGPQRRAYGEQVSRASCVLAAITGNVGVSGGWASGHGFQASGGPLGVALPLGYNPVLASIPVQAWDEAVVRGKGLGPEIGVRGVDRLDNNIKLIYAVATNCLVNQHMNINRSTKILADESLVEFLVVQDQFLTSTGLFADILLPVCTSFETWGIQDGWKHSDCVILMPKILDPPYETKSDYGICAEIAERLGIGRAFTQGRDERGWIEYFLDMYRKDLFPDIPRLDEFEQSNMGAYTFSVTDPHVPFEDFRKDPIAHPLNTPSGKIEIFSTDLYDKARPSLIPAVPKYIQEWESPFGPEAELFPLQAMGSHTMHRVHSTHDNNDWLAEAFPQRVYMNPLDAQDRGIQDGDTVKVFNDRGVLMLPCRLTQRIMPGVIDIPQGAWWSPDEDGVCHGGSINVLTSERLTPFAFGNAQHTIMVQVEKV